MRKGRRSSLARWLWVLLLVAGTGSRSVQVAESEEGTVPRKPVWKWTLDERLATRFDPEGMAARCAEHAARMQQQHPELSVEEFGERRPGQYRDVLDGKRTPEIYLPWELLNMLLRYGFPPDAENLSDPRLLIDERAAALGFGSDLWNRLEVVAAPFLRLQQEEDRHRQTSPSGTESLEGKGDSINLCRARAQAMEAAKVEFGEEAFLRLLYEAVAPHVHSETAFVGTGIVERKVEDLRFKERGCR